MGGRGRGVKFPLSQEEKRRDKWGEFVRKDRKTMTRG